MITADQALPGRPTPLRMPTEHFVNGHHIQPPFPDGLRTAVLGMGCFWGAERIFWQTPGVYSTAVGYASHPAVRDPPAKIAARSAYAP
jgi:peptide-methionine (S)-S-oxide reductase